MRFVLWTADHADVTDGFCWRLTQTPYNGTPISVAHLTVSCLLFFAIGVIRAIRGKIISAFPRRVLENGIAAQRIEYWIEAYRIVCRMTSRSLVRLEYADTRDVVYEAFRQLRLLTEG